MNRFLIVKTSAIGDVVQTFPVLDYLRTRFPEAQIDWVVEQACASLLQSHPQINRVFIVDIKKWRKSLAQKSTWSEIQTFYRELRSVEYDVLFDLQGNTKSALITGLAKAKEKVGFGLRTVREKPNMLATTLRFDVPQEGNIRSRYLNLLLRYFNETEPHSPKGISLKLSSAENGKLEQWLSSSTQPKIMVCFGSKWRNKQLKQEVLLELLKRIDQTLNPYFFFIYGSEEERLIAAQLEESFSKSSQSVGRLSLPLWQAFMGQMTAVLAVDSAGLHLCGTTDTPSFSFFGPSSSSVYMPLGSRHRAFQGSCPYGQTFEKHCSILRTCATGACLREQSSEQIFQQFMEWWQQEVQSQCEFQPLESPRGSSSCPQSEFLQ